MADFNNPLSNQGYLALLASIVENNQATLTMLEGVATQTNLPVNAKKWNPINSRFERWDGTFWTELSALYEMKVRNTDQLNSNTAAYYLNAGNLNAGVLPAGQFNDATHGVRSGGLLHVLANGTTAGFMPPFEFNKLSGIEAGATADMTASEIITALITVDGAGSGLDADTLDSYHASNFLFRANNLAGLTNIATARNNMGLGALATLNAATSSDVATSAITTPKLAALAVTDAKRSKAVSSSGTQVFPSGSPQSQWIPAAGFYNIIVTDTTGTISLFLWNGTAWISSVGSPAVRQGFYWFDGSTMKLMNSTGTDPVTIFWQKLG